MTNAKEEPLVPDPIIELEAPPSQGITIEFPYSTAQSFDFALRSATQLPGFRQFGSGKKAIYRVTIPEDQTDSLMELLEQLKGWRRRTVYVNGEKVTWDSAFTFSYCFEKKKASFKPEYYCFGYEQDYQFNIWGCVQATLPFIEHSEWFRWGQWLNNKGDWQFDKQRILHELQKRLFPYRLCPALQPSLVKDVISALPDAVNPAKNKNWKFVESWGDQSAPGLVVVVSRYGFKEQVKMVGVAPNGSGALKEITQRMKFRLPPFPNR